MSENSSETTPVDYNLRSIVAMLFDNDNDVLSVIEKHYDVHECKCALRKYASFVRDGRGDDAMLIAYYVVRMLSYEIAVSDGVCNIHGDVYVLEPASATVQSFLLEVEMVRKTNSDRIQFVYRLLNEYAQCRAEYDSQKWAPHLSRAHIYEAYDTCNRVYKEYDLLVKSGVAIKTLRMMFLGLIRTCCVSPAWLIHVDKLITTVSSEHKLEASAPSCVDEYDVGFVHAIARYHTLFQRGGIYGDDLLSLSRSFCWCFSKELREIEFVDDNAFVLDGIEYRVDCAVESPEVRNFLSHIDTQAPSQSNALSDTCDRLVKSSEVHVVRFVQITKKLNMLDDA